MALLTRGSVITIVAAGHDAILHWRSWSLETLVADLLRQQNLFVVTSRLATPSWISTAAVAGLLTDSYPYTLTIQVQTSIDYGDPRDVLLIAFHALFQLTGEMPTGGVSEINSVPTGIPVPGPPAVEFDPGAAVASTGQSVFDNFKAIGANLGTIELVAIVIGLGVAAVVLFNVGGATKHVRAFV